MTQEVTTRIEDLVYEEKRGMASCLAYVSDLFSDALRVARQMSVESRANPDDPASGMPVDDSLVVAIYDRLNAEMQIRQVDAPQMPPRGGDDGRIQL